MGRKTALRAPSPEVTKPELPPGAPPALQGFLDCTGNRLRLRPGKIRWLKGQPEIPDPTAQTPIRNITSSSL